MNGARPLVMLIGDDVDMVFVTEALLVAAGYRVFAASHGREALDLLADGTVVPRAIILDLAVPNVTGWQVWDWLQQSHLKHVPVVIRSATGQTTGSIGNARVLDTESHPTTLLTALVELLAARPEPASGVDEEHDGERDGKHEGKPKSPLILLVDDHDEVRESTGYLERVGFAVTAAANGRVAADALLAGLNPDAIVLDLDMPGMDGQEFRAWLHGSRSFSRVPVVIYTGTPAQGIDAVRIVRKGKHPSLLATAVRDAMSSRA